jgi:hypothetical protein
VTFISDHEFEIIKFTPDEGSMVLGGLGRGTGTICLKDLDSNENISRRCTFRYNWYIRYIIISDLDGFQNVGISDDIPYNTPLKIIEFTWNNKIRYELKQSDFFRYSMNTD